MTARILDITPAEYHELGNFSSTVAKTVLARSPAHAKALVGKVPTKLMDRGAIVHRLLLGRGAEYQVVQHGDWRTKAAQAARDAARAADKVPVLADDFEGYNVAAEAIRVQLADRGIVLDGDSEVPIEWEEQTAHGIVLCKGMPDHAWLKRGTILDLKVTDDASPLAIERSAENMGYAIQAAAYTRAVTALDPTLAGRIKFLFAFCEPDEPYAMNIVQPDGVFRELGERRWLRAVSTWGECQKNGQWPAFGTKINQLSSPPWALSREESAA